MNSFQISTYYIEIEPDFDRFLFSGTVNLHLNASEPTAAVKLNVMELSIGHCSVISEGRKQVCAYRLDAVAEELVVELPEPVTGDFQLSIHYNGTINDKMAGFYRSSYKVDGETGYLAVTQFQESSARMAFPCQDHPRYKARFEITLVIDDHLTAVSNTRIKEVHRLANGKKRVRFHPSPIMSTYLVFFGIGRFEYIGDAEDRRMGLLSTPGLSEHGAFGLEFGRKALAFCEQYYGIDYPLDKMDLLAIPDFAFGAMENWGAITFRENLLLCFEGVTSQAGLARICEVTAHEIAHQWFGNLVTPSDWRYLWLNESFATYFGYGVVDHYYPQWNIWEQFIVSQTQSALSRDSLIENFPIEIPGGEHVVINTSTAPLIYSKGGSILRQIEGYMGGELFRKGIQSYLKSHAYDCADSHHLWEAFESVSGMPITAVMKSWIEQPGHPVIEVERTDNTLILRQKRFTFLPMESSQEWEIPVAIALYFDDGRVENEHLLMEGRESRFELKDGLQAYKLNQNQTGFYRVDYLERQNHIKLQELASQKKLGPEDRWGLQVDLFAHVLNGSESLTTYLDLLGHYLQEDAFLPLMTAMDNLLLAYRILDERWHPAISARGCQLAQAILDRTGWNPEADEPHSTALLRDHIVWPAAIFGLAGIHDFGAEKFEAAQQNESLHPDIQKSIFQLAAVSGHGEAFNWLTQRAVSTTSEHERLNIYTALGCFNTWKIVQTALEFTIREIPMRNRFIPIVSAAENPHAIPFLWQWYQANLETLEQIHPLLYERIVTAVIPLGGLKEPAAVKDFMMERLKIKNLAADTIRLALERLEIFTRMRDRHASLTPPTITI